MAEEKKKPGVSRAVVLITALILVVATALVLVILRLVVTMDDNLSFQTGTTVNSVDVSGLTASEAEEKLNGLAKNYALRVQFADGERSISGQELELQVNPQNELRSLVRAQNRGGENSSARQSLELEEKDLFQYDENRLNLTINAWSNLKSLSDQKSRDARLVYSEEMGKFKVEPEQVGGGVDAKALEQLACQKVSALETNLDVVDEGLYGEIRTSDNAEMQTALAEANEKLKLELVYHFEVPSADISGTETIGYDQLSHWLFVEKDGITIGVDSDQLQNYVTRMWETYSVENDITGEGTSKFITSTGQRVTVSVPANGETVDTDALYNDILSCIDSRTSGDRDAPYSEELRGTTDLGGSYVEVDLDGQHLWVYRDHELMAEGDICSGDVATGCATPEGLYTIKSMETDRWLNGADYHDWVSYWMPFNGGIGIHDATWRSEDKDFGGEVYLKTGSHGCINTPLGLAQQIYENVGVGTYVILYGGVNSLAEKAQVITGRSAYTKQVGDGAFYLDAATTGNGKLRYASSNTRVVKVNSSGKVTIVGEGEATIRVSARATKKYRRASKDIEITVTAKKDKDAEQSDSDADAEQTDAVSSGDAQAEASQS